LKRKGLVLVVLVAALIVAAGVLGSGRALAYGHADQPVAQVEVSGNCTNASWCNANFDGTGGLWIWAELDADHSVDGTFAGCGHTVGGAGGPGGAGGGGGPVSGDWQLASNIFDTFNVNPDVFPIALALNSDGSLNLNVPYYVITLHSGGPEGDFPFAVPAKLGHYNYSGLQFINGIPAGTKIPGLNFQTQVAP
jgi:hypothetical protein